MAHNNTNSSSSSPSPPTLQLITRFTTSIPDIPLTLNPHQTTVIHLKHLLRQALPPPTSSHRLRLIYSGKILSDNTLLSSILKLTAPPPRQDVKGKGKAAEAAVELQRIYVNCSIGDELSEEELRAEEEAVTLDISARQRGMEDTSSTLSRESHAEFQTITSTTPAPRGFDRLLDTGFTAAEVGQLRLQFRSIRALNYTPDTMPSADSMRRMEDEWIDDNGAMGSGGGSSQAEADVAAGAVDDLIMGLVIGFMWPLGVVCWLIREDGIWSPRRQVAIWSGFMIAVVFGCMNYLG